MANEMIDTWVCRKICKMEPNLLLKQQKMLESHSLLAQRFVRDANAKDTYHAAAALPIHTNFYSDWTGIQLG